MNWILSLFLFDIGFRFRRFFWTRNRKTVWSWETIKKSQWTRGKISALSHSSSLFFSFSFPGQTKSLFQQPSNSALTFRQFSRRTASHIPTIRNHIMAVHLVKNQRVPHWPRRPTHRKAPPSKTSKLIDITVDITAKENWKRNVRPTTTNKNINKCSNNRNKSTDKPKKSRRTNQHHPIPSTFPVINGSTRRLNISNWSITTINNRHHRRNNRLPTTTNSKQQLIQITSFSIVRQQQNKLIRLVFNRRANRNLKSLKHRIKFTAIWMFIRRQSQVERRLKHWNHRRRRRIKPIRQSKTNLRRGPICSEQINRIQIKVQRKFKQIVRPKSLKRNRTEPIKTNIFIQRTTIMSTTATEANQKH